MPIIVLSEEVASKIAAGEVVERPISVVKELVENSIDAGATEIFIKVEQAGKKLIEVTDNGVGIAIEESDIAVKRYATSKITSAQDLNNIRTLGFRGEALASIAAVSRFSIESRVKDQNIGFYSFIEGGIQKSKKEIGHPGGTRIKVEDLFFNIPARLKFLKKDITERRLINQVISRYALFYSKIRFTLHLEGRKVLSTGGNGNRREVLTQIYDVDTAKSFLEVNYSDEYIKVEGFTSPLQVTRSSRKGIFFFVNGRLINDSSLTAAVTRAYQGLLMVGRFPISSLFIDIQPSEIDVNVHPTKAEIRLQDPHKVFSVIQRSIRKTITAFAPYPAVSPDIWQKQEKIENFEYVKIKLDTEENSENEAILEKKSESEGLFPRSTTNILLLRLIGQLGTTYIAAEGPDGLYLIDQHAAHERILYEKIKTPDSTEINSQLLLKSVVINLTENQFELFETVKSSLQEIGFQLESFGPNSIKINAVPQVLNSVDPKAAILSAIEDDEDSIHELLTGAKKEIVITKICKRLAIKSGQTLSIPEQYQLIHDLEKCRNPRTCPHGRPTMIHISVDALERQFGRKGSI